MKRRILSPEKYSISKFNLISICFVLRCQLTIKAASRSFVKNKSHRSSLSAYPFILQIFHIFQVFDQFTINWYNMTNWWLSLYLYFWIKISIKLLSLSWTTKLSPWIKLEPTKDILPTPHLSARDKKRLQSEMIGLNMHIFCQLHNHLI